MSVRAKKSLGQHFLRSRSAIEAILDAASLKDGDLVLEIGPGEGALTQGLLRRGGTVIAIEADARCVTSLRERFANEISQGTLRIIHGDVREEGTAQVAFSDEMLGIAEYRLVANIPYYLTGYLFRLFLEKLRQPTRIVFLVQKEVADEACARGGKEGLLSLSIKAFGTPHYVRKVGREAFSPPPKVDSAVILIDDIDRERVPKALERRYFAIVKAGLGSRRKMLLGNLVRAFPGHRAHIEDAFRDLSIERGVRGEDLPFERWLALVRSLPAIDGR